MGRGNFGQNCPHCGSKSTIRTSKMITKLVREYRFQCNNTDCGHTWVSQLGIVRTITPSNVPDPTVNLPMTLNQRKQTKPEPAAAPPPTG